jgi:branched-chain amino acid aminotransferase
MIFSFKKNKHATPKNQISKIIAKISGFGGQLTNYMSHIHYENGNWINHEIIPVANLSLPPSTSCFHYGQEIFEGLKAYKDDQGKIYTFRIKDNAKRFQDSAKRIGLPILSISDFCSSITQLLMIEKD